MSSHLLLLGSVTRPAGGSIPCGGRQRHITSIVVSWYRRIAAARRASKIRVAGLSKSVTSWCNRHVYSPFSSYDRFHSLASEPAPARLAIPRSQTASAATYPHPLPPRASADRRGQFA